MATPPSGDSPERRLRMQLKPNVPTSGYVDGAWWPRSRELTVELPELLTALSDQLGPAALVGYHSAAWNEAPASVEVAGHTVELQGFVADEPASVVLIGGDDRRLTLLVIASDAKEQIAQRELDSAAEPREDGATAAHAPDPATARSLAEVATRLFQQEGSDDTDRAATIMRWVDEAGEQFVDARIRAYVAILVEHIVRNRMIASGPRSDAA